MKNSSNDKFMTFKSLEKYFGIKLYWYQKIYLIIYKTYLEIIEKMFGRNI
jgi:hypothetical protein